MVLATYTARSASYAANLAVALQYHTSYSGVMSGLATRLTTPRHLLAVGLLACATLSFELVLTRLFALAQFYHFAFLVISLALLGTGSAGSLLSVWPRLGAWVSWSAVGFALSAIACYAALDLIPFDSYVIAIDPRQFIYLLILLTAAMLPFGCSGLVTGYMLSMDAAGAHRIYAANLVGSALGCGLALPLYTLVGGERTLFLSAALGASAGMLLHQVDRRSQPSRRGGRHRLATTSIFLVIAAAVLVTAIGPSWLALRLSPYKALSQALLAPDARHVLSTQTLAARVDVVQSGTFHVLPGLSQNAGIAMPPLQAGLTLDGDNVMPLTALSPDDELARRLAANVPLFVVKALRPDAASFLVLEPGGGWDVLMLLAMGAPAVVSVEQNPTIAAILVGPLASDLYRDPRVTVIPASGRVYLRAQPQTFDIIDVALSDSFHPITSGAYSLSEDYRYTVEAMREMLRRLSPHGVLVITRWLQTPPTEPLRVMATAYAALRAQGAPKPGDHIAAFRSLRTITFVISPQPLAPVDQDAIRKFTDSRGYDLVWLPAIHPDETNQHIRLPEEIYYQSFVAFLANPDQFERDYAYDVRPPTDDRPFFYHYFRWGQTPTIIASIGRVWQPFGGSGYLVLVALLAQASLLVVLLILGPLILRRNRSGQNRVPPGVRRRSFVYFSMLGLGFLLIEIPLAQRLILFVGQPVTALAVVLFALLLFSGCGSLTAPRWRLELALGLLAGLVLGMPVALQALSDLALGWSLASRILLTIVALAPLGLLMGIPFAGGLRRIGGLAPGLVPWLWAVNGSASVLSAILAVMIALSAGFTLVLWLGAAAYAIALLAIIGMGHPDDGRAEQ